MSVVSLNYRQPGQTFTIKGSLVNSSREVSVPITLFTDNARDSEGVISIYLRDHPEAPYPGRTYDYNGAIEPELICKDVQCRPVENNPKQWELTANYGPDASEDPEKKPDNDGKMTDNPFDWAPEIDIGTSQASVPVEKARYMGGYSGTADGECKKNDGVTKPCSSALVPHNPPLERQDSTLVFRASNFYPKFSADVALNYKDKINFDDIDVTNPLYHIACGKYCALVRHYGATLQTKQLRGKTVFCWRVSVEIHIDPRGWDREVADTSLVARRWTNDPDGKGGIVVAGSRPPGKPPHDAIKDKSETPISDPVLLNGNGQPLADSVVPIYGKWRIQDARELGPLFSVNLQ